MAFLGVTVAQEPVMIHSVTYLLFMIMFSSHNLPISEGFGFFLGGGKKYSGLLLE